MANVVVVGTQWGDEGKGKVVDLLAEFADFVVRPNGGSDVGHTVAVDDGFLSLRLVPAGALHPSKRNVIGSGALVDPDVLTQELAELAERGVALAPRRLVLSDQAHLVFPWHRMIEQHCHQVAGPGSPHPVDGLAAALADKTARIGLRAGDLLQPDVLERRLGRRLELLAQSKRLPAGEGAPTLADELARCQRWADQIGPYVSNVSALLNHEMDRGRSVLFEGIHGTLVDPEHGTYPYTVSSSTLASAACDGTGIGPRRIDAVIGVAKAFATRYREGPFPTEETGPAGQLLRNAADEFTPGHRVPRRCGWLDIVALRHSLRVNGLTGLALTKLDALSGIDQLKICVGYQVDGERLDHFPTEPALLERCKPLYEEARGWPEPLDEARTVEELPDGARHYIRRIEELLEIPVVLLSVGRRRGDSLIIKNPFR